MKLAVDFSCPSCGHKMKQRAEKMRPGGSRSCGSCGTMIRFSGDDGRKAQQALNDLKKAVKKLSRKSKF